MIFLFRSGVGWMQRFFLSLRMNNSCKSLPTYGKNVNTVDTSLLHKLMKRNTADTPLLHKLMKRNTADTPLLHKLRGENADDNLLLLRIHSLPTTLINRWVCEFGIQILLIKQLLIGTYFCFHPNFSVIQ